MTKSNNAIKHIPPAIPHISAVLLELSLSLVVAFAVGVPVAVGLKIVLDDIKIGECFIVGTTVEYDPVITK